MTTQNHDLTEEQKLAQFAALIGGDIDSIEDLPEYATFEEGSYTLVGTAAEIKLEKGRLTLQFAKTGLVEKAEGVADENIPVDGALLGVNYVGKFGLQKFKKLFLPLVKQLGCTSIEQFVDQFENLNFIAVLSKRESDKKPGQFFNDIVAITLAP